MPEMTRPRRLCPLVARMGVLLSCFLLAVLLCAPPASAASGRFLSFSDLHFNPFYDQSLAPQLAQADAAQWESIFATSSKTTLPSYGQESNYPLFTSLLASMRQVEPQPDFILFSGDLLAHHFSERYAQATGDSSQAGLESFIAKTVDFFARTVDQYFPRTPVYLCLGNNDAYAGDYRIIPQGEFLKDSAQLLAERFFESSANQSAFQEQYPLGGYYAVELPGGESTRLLVLDTNFFSVNYPQEQMTRAAGYDPGLRELNWLERQLDQARDQGQKVWLMAHIPPGVNVYNTLHEAGNTLYHLDQVPGFWRETYRQKFVELLNSHAASIAAVFSGHTHMDDFRLSYLDDQANRPALLIHINPAVSPQFGNNPAFKLFEYRPGSLELLDYTTYYVDVGQEGIASQGSTASWSREYSFRQAYGRQAITPLELDAIYRGLEWDQGLQDKYMLYYRVSDTEHPFKPQELKAYRLGIGVLDPAEYKTRYNQSGDIYRSSQDASGVMLPLAAAGGF